MSSTALDAEALKPAPNQVAGHRVEEGRVGSLVDSSGKFYKPLQSGDRGDAEAAFYQKLFADAKIPSSILSVFPKCHGVVDVPVQVAAGGATDAPGSTKYLVMEDLTAGYQRPCIFDIKMGKRTWFEGAPQKYIDKCLEKDASTTSGALGYRVAGLQVYDPKADTMWRAGRKWCKDVTVEGMPAALAKFVSSDPGGEGKLDKDIAEAVLQGEQGFLEKLKILRTWFATQRSYQFYSASILIIYEGKANEGIWQPKVSLRLVDFAHVTEVDTEDLNFLEAIDAVASAYEGILSGKQ